MFTAELKFKILREAPNDAVGDAVESVIVALHRNGQILGTDWPIALRKGSVCCFVSLPEASSLQKKRQNKYVRESIAALSQVGLGAPVATVLGREPQSADACTCESRSATILYTDFLSAESPLRCGDCFNPVPLYKIPHTCDYCDTYEDIIFWSRQYHAFDSIWMRSGGGEKFAYKQLSRPDSELSQEGRETCRRIEQKTGRPAYYYLMCYYGKSLALERKRRCPGCGGAWLLKKPWQNRFDFRCQRCKLVSNIADDIR